MTFQPYDRMDQTRAEQLVFDLKEWYLQNQRDLVWRHTRDPYRIWISEIMAQQTRITAVLPYYNRFIKSFPTLRALADAPLDDVLKVWEGLGYYSRAHNLSKTAKILCSLHDGLFPEHPDLLKKLPGIGDYTAGAIASICFDLPVPAVDGNVLRVFARLESNGQDIAVPATKKNLTGLLHDIMPQSGSGIFNQALMELGALICLPKNPLCMECPVASLCLAKKQGRQTVLPVKSAKKEPVIMQKTILLITNPQGEIVLRQRNETLLKGLWEFYMSDCALMRREIPGHLQSIGYTPGKIFSIGQATHIFTHQKWHMHGYHCQVSELSEPEGFALVSIDDMLRLAMPTAISYFRAWALQHLF